jgi:short-subunit dehydrogenase
MNFYQAENNPILIMERIGFKNKVVIITGASAGIGKELAIQLASKGALLVLAARDLKKLKEVAEQCTALGSKTIAVKTDVSLKENCEKLINKTIKQFGRIDALINNAGLTMFTRFDEIENIDLFEKIMKVNYLGSVYCTYFALPYLKESKGRIIGISSLTGKTGVPTRTAYSASKHAMAGFFDSLRIELKDSGVSVTMIYPGFVATEVRQRALGANGKPLGTSHLNESNVMSVSECATQIIEAAEKRKRELVMTFKAKLGLWIKLVNPNLVDAISLKSIEEGN